MKGLLLFSVLLILLFSTSAFAGFEQGVDAHKRGDYTTSLKEWKLAVEQGHAAAQHNLGVMYDNGIGVLPRTTRLRSSGTS